MLPDFIPYIIKRESYIDSETCEPKCWSYDKKFRLYHTPSKRLVKFLKIDKAYYVDEFLESSIALVLECNTANDKTQYTIVSTLEDLKSPLWFDYLKVIDPQIIVARKNNKWRVINDKLQMRCFFEYDSLEEYISLSTNRIFFVGKKGDKYGILNEDLFIRFQFDYTSITCNNALGIFVLEGNSVTTVFDIDNNSISKFQFIISSIKDINEGCIVVERDKKYCVYDTDTQSFITDKWFNNIDTFQNGFSLCDKRYILYRDGKIVDLGEACYYRTGDIIYSTYHLHDEVWGVSIFRQEKFLCKITHDKGPRGIFYYHIVGGKYLEVGSHNMKYLMNTPQAIYDFEGNLLPISILNDIPKENKIDAYKIASGYWAKKRSKAHKKVFVMDDIEEFENKHFSKSKYLSGWDSYELLEIEHNLLRLKTMSVDAEFGCDWTLVGYIYNDINLWADIHISND